MGYFKAISCLKVRSNFHSWNKFSKGILNSDSLLKKAMNGQKLVEELQPLQVFSLKTVIY